MRVKPIKKTDKQYKQKDPVQKAGARKTVSVPAVMSAGTQAADKVMSAVIFCAKKWKTEKEYGIIEAEKS